MFITISDASKGKPLQLPQTIDNTNQNLKIGIRSVAMWIGWYNIYEDETCRWAFKNQKENSNEIVIPAGLYNFKELTSILTNAVENLTISVDPTNGLIDMVVPPNVEIFLTEAVRYLLGITIEETGWIEGEYVGDKAIEFVPKQIYIYLKQLLTSDNFLSLGKKQRLVQSQLLGFLPMSIKAKNLFGAYIEKSFSDPDFVPLMNGPIHELDFDFKVEWSNGVMQKLDNHEMPIRFRLEIK